MAENPIDKNAIIDGPGIKQVLEEIISLLKNDLNAALKSVTDTALQYKSAMSSANTATKEGQDIVRTTSESTQQLAREKARITATEKELERAERALIKAQREETEVNKTAEGSYKRLSLEMRKLVNQWKEADATTRNKLTPQIKKLDTELKKLDASIGRSQRNVGNYSSAWKGVGKSVLAATGIVGGATLAFRALFNVIKNGFKTTWDFEQQMSYVKSVSGATAEEFDRLRESAILLGGSTKFTASQVASLQVELAKLGFTSVEILNMSGGILDLAAATGSNLAESAEVAGATLRQFGLASTEMKRVVDVMTLSFARSALDMNKFSVAMATAGPVAASFGETIESTTGKLSVLANRGLDASTAGTSLRNIFLELQTRGLTFDEAMNKVQGSTNKAAVALDLFGKRGAVAGLILADNKEEAKSLAEEYENAEGSAREMAETMQDNVAGSIIKLQSAWEGMTLRINESSGAIKKFIDLLTTMISGVGTKGYKNIEALFDDTKITDFNSKFMFFIALGEGYNKAAKMARQNEIEDVQRLKDVFVELGKKRQEALDKRAKEEAEAAAAEKARSDALAAAFEKDIAAEEARREAAEKAQKEIKKGEEQRAANFAKHVEDATKDNEMVAVRIGLAKEEATQLAEIGEQRAATEREIEDKITRARQNSAIQRREIALSEANDILEIVGGSITAISDLYAAQKNRELSAAGDNAKKREEIERKYFRKEQALSIAQAVINGALAVTKAEAQTGVLSFLTIPLIVAQTLAQIAVISSQKFAKGGFTGKGRQRDSTGERVAGIVHEDEFVIDKKKTKKYRPLLEAIHRDDKLAIAAELNNSNLVWARTADLMKHQDPFTEKMFNLMQNTPVIYTDSNGNTVMAYHDGHKRIIKQNKPTMIR